LNDGDGRSGGEAAGTTDGDGGIALTAGAIDDATSDCGDVDADAASDPDDRSVGAVEAGAGTSGTATTA